MAIQSIGSVINSSFIRSFQGLSGSGGAAIGARASSGPSITTGLRFGARTFATAIQTLNQGIGYINIADDTLKKLTKITDKMIETVQESTRISAGAQTRRVLQSEFEDLVAKFRDVVESSSLNSVEYLTQDGLKALFKRIGLDEDSSEGVASIFKRFSETGNDGALVSEETKGKRPPEVPALKRSKATQITDTALATFYTPLIKGSVTPENNIYGDTIAGFEQPVTADSDGSVYFQPGITQNQNILAINPSKGDSVGETTGYSLVTSSEDFTGDNALGFNQIFLIAADGNVVRQVTNFTTLTFIYSADISSDNKTAAVAYSDGVDGRIDILSVANIGDTPGTATLDDSVIQATNSSLNVKISDDGQYLAYSEPGSEITLKQVGGASDTYLTGGPDFFNGFDFIGSGKLVANRNNAEIIAYQFGSSSEDIILAENAKFAILGPDSRYSSNDGSTPTSLNMGHIAYVTDDNKLTVSNFDLDTNSMRTRYRRDLGTGTILTNGLTLSYQNDLNITKDRVDVGIIGTFPALFGDADGEMYRISESRFASNNSLFAPASADPTDVLDGNVLTRADAYRLLGDLKALKQQMSDNIDALAGARDYIASNVELVRAAGFAFLEISNQITGTEDAEQVAQLVAAQIRSNSTQAQLAQVENLKNIASQTVALLG